MEFAIFDIETRIDKQLLNRVFFAHDNISDDEAYLRFREDLRNRGGDFVPLSLHVPISIAIGNVSGDHTLHSVETLGTACDSEEGLVREFWTRLEDFRGCIVSFNGRRFDLPVLELAAIRWGISAPRYFDEGDSPRSHPSRHLDLCEYLTNFGEVGLRGGMDLLLKMMGLPGKLAINGAMVQEYFDSGRHEEIHRYCRTDVVQTYFLFLRVALMRGRIDQASYQAAWSAALPFLEELGALRAKSGAVG
jgi:predicted PolB exonuclease-like 3'-5' exonuclease